VARPQIPPDASIQEDTTLLTKPWNIPLLPFSWAPNATDAIPQKVC
jgi:hypothetical protein